MALMLGEDVSPHCALSPRRDGTGKLGSLNDQRALSNGLLDSLTPFSRHTRLGCGGHHR